MDSRYSEIQAHIRQAHIERSVIVAELLSNAIIATWNGLKTVVESVLAATQIRRRRTNVFTFDA